MKYAPTFAWNVYMCRGLLVLLFSLCGCDELLPPREEPKTFLQAEYSVASGVVEIRDSVAVGLGGSFVISVKNIYTEVLQDFEFARVDIDVWLRDTPAVGGKVVSTKRELTDRTLVFGGQLTLRPNVSATFLKQWEHRTISGRRFWEYVPLTPKVTQTGEPYLESDPVNFVASGKAQLFKAKAPERLPQIQFSLVYRIF